MNINNQLLVGGIQRCIVANGSLLYADVIWYACHKSADL